MKYECNHCGAGKILYWMKRDHEWEIGEIVKADWIHSEIESDSDICPKCGKKMEPKIES